jgi:hypothetical protein
MLTLAACVGVEEALAAAPPPPAFDIVPVPAGEQEAQIVELRRQEEQMGGQPRVILEGKLSLDGAQAHRLLPHASAAPALAPVIPRGSQLYLVKVDFTLHKLAERKICREMIFYLSLEDPDTAFVDLFPKHINSVRDRPQSLTVSRTAQLMGVADRSGPFPLDELVPEVTGYRDDVRTLYWVFRPAREGDSIAQGTRSVFFLLRLPEQRATASLAMRSEADIGSYLFGELWWPGSSKTEARMIAVRLK